LVLTAGARGRAALVGREEELAVLGLALSELAVGRGGCVAIGGEPGIGKTRLAQETAAIAERQGCWVMSGRATELEQDVPFAVAISALDPALGSFARPLVKRIAPELVTELEAVFPALAGGAGDRPPRLQAERYRLHHAIGALVGELAAQRPVVLVLDDLHWADAASLELVAHLLRRPPAGPVLLMLAYRFNQAPAELLVAVAAAAREGSLTQIELAALGESEAEELVGDVDPPSRAAIYRESGGNPFYLEELARAHRARPRPPIGQTNTLDERGVPAGVRVVIEQEELARLSARARSVLRAASVVGDPFDPAIAAAVAEVDESDALAALDEAAARELVQHTQLARSLRFRHPIVRRTVYESGGPAWRIGAHARAAIALAEQGAPVMSRAPHVQRCARPGDEVAIALLSAAAHDAAPRAPAVAARWFQAALDLLPTDSSAERRLALLTPMAASLTAAGRTAQSREVLARVLALLPTASPSCARRLSSWSRVSIRCSVARDAPASSSSRHCATHVTARRPVCCCSPWASSTGMPASPSCCDPRRCRHWSRRGSQTDRRSSQRPPPRSHSPPANTAPRATRWHGSRRRSGSSTTSPTSNWRSASRASPSSVTSPPSWTATSTHSRCSSARCRSRVPPARTGGSSL